VAAYLPSAELSNGLYPSSDVSSLTRRLSGLVLTIAMVSYLVMATGLGVTYVPIHYHGHEASNYRFLRELFYARSIDWLFTTPLLLLSLAVLAGLSPYETTLAILADVFMIVTGLFASLVPARWAPGERARWGFFTVSCVAFLWIWWILITNGFKGELNVLPKAGRDADSSRQGAT